MTAQSLESQIAVLRNELENLKTGRIAHLETEANETSRCLYGEDGKGGLIGEMRDFKTENRYLRYIYALIGFIAVPILNFVLGKLGLPAIK